jgi:hypothetical protein
MGPFYNISESTNYFSKWGGISNSRFVSSNSPWFIRMGRGSSYNDLNIGLFGFKDQSGGRLSLFGTRLVLAV